MEDKDPTINSNINTNNSTHHINVTVNVPQSKKKSIKKKSSPNWFKIKLVGGFLTLAFSVSGYYIKKYIDEKDKVNVATNVVVNISGEWYMTFTNESSTYKPFIGEIHTQRTFFTQIEKTISGKGEKWEYNGKLLNDDQHRKLEYIGTIDGYNLKASYTLHGERRVSEGLIDVVISNDGKKMTGTFSGTAGNCKGRVIGEKK